jgi:uncharacterized protein
MNEIKPFSMRSFKEKVRRNKRKFRRFLTGVEKQTPKGFRKLTAAVESEVWKETDCLGCANCCKTMTPTFTETDIKRISAHFNQTPEEFKKKWLLKDRVGDWVNKKQPCQFLDLTTNKCSIYAIRPADCAGFPHLLKPMKGYAHVHKQNIECCPATYRIVEKMMEGLQKNVFK